MNQFELEERQLEDDYAAGLLTNKQFQEQMQALHRDWREAARAQAEEEAQAAYDAAMDQWSF